MAKYYRNVIVNQAKAWLGKKESDGSHREIIDIYNSHKPLARGYAPKYTSAWCSAFISAVSIKCGYTAIIPTEVSCHYHVELFKKLGCFVESDSYVPKSGDIIFYDWNDSNPKSENKNSPDHVGIVESVSGNTITVIEGNCDSAVKRRTIKVNGKYIRGYGVPKYDADKPQESVSKPQTTTDDKSIDEMAKEVLEGKYGNGSARVNALGDKYAKVQAKVNELLKAMRENAQKQQEPLKVGDTVKVLKAVQFDNGKPFAVYYNEYKVMEVAGDRICIGVGDKITCAIHRKNLKKL